MASTSSSSNRRRPPRHDFSTNNNNRQSQPRRPKRRPGGELDHHSRPTHFLALPIGHHTELRNTVSSLTSSWLAHQPPIEGLDPSIVVQPRRLHFTLGVMTLNSPHDLASATTLLDTSLQTSIPYWQMTHSAYHSATTADSKLCSLTRPVRTCSISSLTFARQMVVVSVGVCGACACFFFCSCTHITHWQISPQISFITRSIKPVFSMTETVRSSYVTHFHPLLFYFSKLLF
jgi:AKAP7 2'5' RNA ligase-like domain